VTDDKKYQIMFVCSGNTCRSPMAEYALRSLLDREAAGKTEVFSTGTLGLSGQPATAYAQEAARIWDLDLTAHRNQPLIAELINQADLIFAMAPEHHREITRLVGDASAKTYLLKSFPGSAANGEKIVDPIGMELDYYNEVFLEIGELLGQHLPEILKRMDR
jgi:protein-tyrosine-phosphatase